ncbi:MAG TPA: Ig-like domain repeat protein [Candidatus Acidoferrales bacterium]
MKSPSAGFARLFAAVVLSMLFANRLPAQTQAATSSSAANASLLAQIDERQRVPLKAPVHPLARAEFDRGAVGEATPTGRVILRMARPADREAALEQFLRDAHTPGTPSYHQWVTTQQFGARFGADPASLQMVSAWLASHGFAVEKTYADNRFIRFSGNAGQMRSAFGAEIHAYVVNGEMHHANAAALSVPAALAGAIAGLAPLNDFNAKPQWHSAGTTTYTQKAAGARPQFTLNGMIPYAVAPEDFATQYDLKPLYAAGVNGSGVTIGLIGLSNIDLNSVSNFRALFGLPAMVPQVVIDGNDPGDVPGADVEAFFDLEQSGAVAPNAALNLYVSGGGLLNDPLYDAALRAVDDNQASVISMSYSNCESNLTIDGNHLWSAIWEQAAAQGQTVFVSSGDSGPAECDNANQQFVVANGFGVNGLASTPWNVAVGGTDFYYSDYATGAASAATLWSQTNDGTYGSLKAPLPEQVWDTVFGKNATAYVSFDAVPSSGGGKSSIAFDGPTGGFVGYPKPSWQVGAGVPADGVRDVPDVSLFAADGSNLSAYPLCASEQDCSAAPGQQGVVELVGGTSGATPAMAGILALVNQKYGRQGQAAYALYALAQRMPSAFHDVTIGTNNVPCEKSSPNCTADTGDSYDSLQEYPAAAGYDLATGLGSVDANLLVTNWSSGTLKTTTTTFTISPTTLVAGEAPAITAKVKPSSGGGTPQGAITIESNANDPLVSGLETFTLDSKSSVVSTDTPAVKNVFPAGTYDVWAKYSGDGTFATSESSPQTITVSQASSGLTMSAYVSGNALPNPATYCSDYLLPGSFIPSGEPGNPSGQSYTSGFPFFMYAQLARGATGNVMFTLDNQPPVPVAVTTEGTATWGTPANLPAGTHLVAAAYPGDGTFLSSTATPFSFTFNPQTPNLFLSPGANCTEVNVLGPNSMYVCGFSAGDDLVVNVNVNAYGCQSPPGAVTVNLGSRVQTVTLAPGPIEEHGASQSLGYTTFTNVAAGTYALTATYPGDVSFLPVNTANTYGPETVSVTTPPGPLAVTTTTVVANPSTIVSLGQLDGSYTLFTVNVTGPPTATSAPTGVVTVYSDGSEVSQITLAPTGPNTAGGTSLGPVTIEGLDLGQNMITADYSGDAYYKASEGLGTFTLLEDATPDFTMALEQPSVTLAGGGSTSVGLNLGIFYQYSGTVKFSCTPSSSAISCNVTPASATINGPMTITLNVSSVAAAARPTPVKSWGLGGGKGFGAIFGTALAMMILVFAMAWFGGGKRVRVWAGAGVLTAALVMVASCGGGSGGTSGGGGGGGGGGTNGGVPPAVSPVYSVLVTGASGTSAHDVKLLVEVH